MASNPQLKLAGGTWPDMDARTCLSAQSALIIDSTGVRVALCCQRYAVHAARSHLHNLNTAQ